MKIVCDTNILISAFVFPGGPPEQVINLAKVKDVELFLSPDILSEFKKVLTGKFKFSSTEVLEFRERVLAISSLVYPAERIDQIKRCQADNRILECAIEAQANYLITGDKRDILPIGKIENCIIVSPRRFLDIWQGLNK
jgi:putative PIN family toxin of toxin-antitoxin system